MLIIRVLQRKVLFKRIVKAKQEGRWPQDIALNESEKA